MAESSNTVDTLGNNCTMRIVVDDSVFAAKQSEAILREFRKSDTRFVTLSLSFTASVVMPITFLS